LNILQLLPKTKLLEQYKINLFNERRRHSVEHKTAIFHRVLKFGSISLLPIDKRNLLGLTKIRESQECIPLTEYK
jgi:hypothetical protein